jgi:hypothetical protein
LATDPIADRVVGHCLGQDQRPGPPAPLPAEAGLLGLPAPGGGDRRLQPLAPPARRRCCWACPPCRQPHAHLLGSPPAGPRARSASAAGTPLPWWRRIVRASRQGSGGCSAPPPGRAPATPLGPPTHRRLGGGLPPCGQPIPQRRAPAGTRLKSPSMALLKAGRSLGCRLVTQLPSSTTSWSSHPPRRS